MRFIYDNLKPFEEALLLSNVIAAVINLILLLLVLVLPHTFFKTWCIMEMITGTYLIAGAALAIFLEEA